MARESAKILTGIWGNPDMRALTLEQQGFYLQVWTHPELSYAGVLNWHPARIAQLSFGTTAATVARLAAEIESRLLFVIDHETQELLVRPWVRHDGALKQPRLSVALANAYASTASNLIRGVFAFELKKLKAEEPGWAAWKSDAVKAILKHPTIDPRTILGTSTGAETGAASSAITPTPTTVTAPGATGTRSGIATPTLTATRQGESSTIGFVPPTTTATTTSTYVDKDLSTDGEREAEKAATKNPYSTDFLSWWSSYPKKESKGDAWKAWETARRTKALPDLEVLVTASKAYAAATPDPTFLKLPAGWLRDRKWEDEKPTSTGPDPWANRERFGGAK